MSRRHEDEIRQAALNAAIEAARNERARCLWVLDELMKKAQHGADNAIMTTAQTQVAKVRAEITKTIVMAAKVLISSGARPRPPEQPAAIIVP